MNITIRNKCESSIKRRPHHQLQHVVLFNIKFRHNVGHDWVQPRIRRFTRAMRCKQMDRLPAGRWAWRRYQQLMQVCARFRFYGDPAYRVVIDHKSLRRFSWTHMSLHQVSGTEIWKWSESAASSAFYAVRYLRLRWLLESKTSGGGCTLSKPDWYLRSSYLILIKSIHLQTNNGSVIRRLSGLWNVSNLDFSAVSLKIIAT